MDSIVEEGAQKQDYKPPLLKGPIMPVKRTFGRQPVKLKSIDENSSTQIEEGNEDQEEEEIQGKIAIEAKALEQAPKPEEIFEVEQEEQKEEQKEKQPEKEQNSETQKEVVQVYTFKFSDQVSFKAPAHSKFPREGLGTILKIHGNGTYDVIIQDQHMTIYKNVPHNYLRPSHILINGSIVETRSLRKVLCTDLYQMPLYQRRYTWQPEQWEALMEDAYKQNHYLGRLTLYEVDGRMVVCDGQQRLTTCLLLLAAIRDVALQLGNKKLAIAMNQYLVPDKEGFKEWKSKGEQIEDAALLPFFRVIPTMADRKSFFKAMIYAESKDPRPTLITRCKAFFVRRLKIAHTTGSQLENFADMMLDAFRLLHFQIEDDGSNQSTYQGLAKREYGLTQTCYVPRPGVSMSPIDFIRNLCLEYFTKQEEIEEFLHTNWLPIEYTSPDVMHMEYYFASHLLSKDHSLLFKQKHDISDHFTQWLPKRLKGSKDQVKGLKKVIDEILEHAKQDQNKETRNKGDKALYEWLVGKM